MSSVYIRCGSSGVPALFPHFYGFVSVTYRCDPTFIACPHGLPIVRYLYWFLGMCGFWSCVFGAFALLTLTVPAQVLMVTRRRVAAVAVFSLVLGLSVLVKEFFALVLVFLGYTCGVAFSLRMPLLRLGHRLR